MRTAVALAVLAVATVATAADLVVRQRAATGPADAPAREETIYVAGAKVVSDSAVARIIVDLDRQTITTADKTKQTYTVLTFDELAAQMEALRKAAEQLPPEQRRQTAALFEDGPPVTLMPTGKTATIAGHPASEYAIAGGPYSGAIWTTEAIPVPPELRRWMAIEKSSGATRGAGRRLGDAMATLKGFPLRSRIETTIGAKPFVVSSEVLEVKAASPPADALAVPPGFTQRAASGPHGTEPRQ